MAGVGLLKINTIEKWTEKLTSGGPRLVRFLGPGENRTMRDLHQLSSTQTEFNYYDFTNKKCHQYDFYTYSTKIRTSGNRTSGDRTSGGPPVLLVGDPLYCDYVFLTISALDDVTEL